MVTILTLTILTAVQGNTDHVSELQTILEGNLEPFEQRRILQQLAKSVRPEHIELLHEIVASEATADFAILDALHCLWLVGGQDDYILNLAKSDNEIVASHAIWVLARRPDAGTARFLDQRKRNSGNSRLLGAISVYDFVLGIVKKYEEEKDERARIELLVKEVRRGFCAWTGGPEEGAVYGNLYPSAVWAQGELKAESSRAPRKVARILVETPDKAYRKYLGTLVTPDCRKEFDSLLDKEK